MKEDKVYKVTNGLKTYKMTMKEMLELFNKSKFDICRITEEDIKNHIRRHSIVRGYYIYEIKEEPKQASGEVELNQNFNESYKPDPKILFRNSEIKRLVYSGLTYEETGQKIGLSRIQVGHICREDEEFMKKLHNKKALDNQHKQNKVLKLYEKGYSYADISKKTGFPRVFVYQALRDNNSTTRRGKYNK